MDDNAYLKISKQLNKQGFERFGWKWIGTLEDIELAMGKYVDLGKPFYQCMMYDIALHILEDTKHNK